MSENEIKLIEMIRSHPNPGEALVKAIEILVLFKHLGLVVNPSELSNQSISSKNHH